MHADFEALYASQGRASIPPEQLLSALLLQVFYGVRSERQLMEQLDYNLLFRWFVGLSPDTPVWVATSFTKNRERLQQGEIFKRFMTVLLSHPRVKPLLSDENFSVDGREAKLCYMGHALMENRHGLAVGGVVTLATGKAEREAAEALLEPFLFRCNRLNLVLCALGGVAQS
jgi:IS5 family transposase